MYVSVSVLCTVCLYIDVTACQCAYTFSCACELKVLTLQLITDHQGVLFLQLESNRTRSL